MFTNCYRFYIYIYSHFTKSGPLRNDRFFKLVRELYIFRTTTCNPVQVVIRTEVTSWINDLVL